jgi:hypothetical protein
MRRQLHVLAALFSLNALLVAATYLFIPYEQLFPGVTELPPQILSTPRELLALAYGLIVLVLYGAAGLIGLWFARRLQLPGTFREGAGWREWFWVPAVLGVVAGVLIVLLDRIFAVLGGTQGFTHPAFPFSIIASGTAGIGEEIMFRSFVLGLWAWLLSFPLARVNARPVALWLGNAIAALAFAAAHLPAVMALYGTADPGALPPLVLAELILLNGGLGLLAGSRYVKSGLVAAVGIHFWADIVWHVIWPLLNALQK